MLANQLVLFCSGGGVDHLPGKTKNTSQNSDKSKK